MGRDETFTQRVTPRDMELLVIEQAQEVAATATMSAGLDGCTEEAVRRLCDAVHDLNHLHAYGGPRSVASCSIEQPPGGPVSSA